MKDKRPAGLKKYPEDKAVEMMEDIIKLKDLVYPLSAREIGEMTGYSKQSVRDWMNGASPVPKVIFKGWKHSNVRIYIRSARVKRLKRGQSTKAKTEEDVVLKTLVLRRLNKSIKKGCEEESERAAKVKNLIVGY